MWLEYDLLQNPSIEGVFTVSTSYRQEPNPIPGRHQSIFPMFEFEGRGDITDLRRMEEELLEHLGFGKQYPFKHLEYEDACDVCEAVDIESEQEDELCVAYGNIVFIDRFPERTSPFWNMYRDGIPNKNGVVEEYARKIDVIIHGQETIGSAEREIDPNLMRKRFETISGGDYAKKLRDLFGKDRVNDELDRFLSLKFDKRYGGGIGIHRLIRGMRLEGILP